VPLQKADGQQEAPNARSSACGRPNFEALSP